MYYTLKEDLLLRGWQLLPLAVVQKGTGEVFFFRNKDYMVLLRCNGTEDVDINGLAEEERTFLNRLVEKKSVLPSETPQPIREEQKYHYYDNRFIRTAHWSITGRCNLKCKHCYMSAPDAKYGELSHETIMDILDQLADCGVQQISLTGGEALVRKDFLEIVDAILAKGMYITQIYSNGLLVTERLLDELDKRGIHPEFNMSYDGVGQHDWLRGLPGAERAVLRAFKLCQEKGFPTGAEMCLHNGNKHTLRESINKLAELGCRSLKTNPISDVGAWHENGYGQSIDPDELLELYVEYIPHFYEDNKPLVLQLGGFFLDSPQRPNYVIPSLKYHEHPESVCSCGHARNTMYISAEGRALPCMALSGMDIQQGFPLVQELGVRNCLTESTYMGLIDTKAATVLAHTPECQDCKYARYCLGGCRACALGDTPDDLLAQDKFVCKLLKEGWIKRINDAVHAVQPENINKLVDEYLQI